MDRQALTRREVSAAFDRYGSRWDAFSRPPSDDGRRLLRDAFELVREHECLAARVYRVRASFGADHPFRRDAEETLAERTFALGALLKAPRPAHARRERRERYRRVWSENLSLFLMTALLFVGGAALGAFAVVSDPANAAALMPQSMIEDVLEGKRWFDVLQKNPLLFGLQIAFHNIRVCLLVFTLGALFGLGGVALLVYNGAMFGATLAFCRLHGFDDQLVGFVSSHGPLELTIVVAAGFASLLLGRAFYLRKSLFPARFSAAAEQAGVVMAGILPWLLLAGLIEAGVSPWPSIPVETKLAVGSAVAVLFLAWSFWPARERRLTPE